MRDASTRNSPYSFRKAAQAKLQAIKRAATVSFHLLPCGHNGGSGLCAAAPTSCEERQPLLKDEARRAGW